MFENTGAWGNDSTSRQGELSDDGVSAPTDRQATSLERQRGRLVLRGQLDEVGLDDLLSSLRSKGRNCVVEVRSLGRRGEITVDQGRVIRVRVDGLSPHASSEAAIAALRGFFHAVFDVFMLDGAAPLSVRAMPAMPSTPPASTPTPPMSVRSPPASSPTPPVSVRYPSSASNPTPSSPTFADGDATEVALAAAVMNSCGAYARKWLGAKTATSIMLSAWGRTSAVHNALDAFRISQDGMVSVSGVERAKSAIPRAVATWVFAVFDGGALFNASRFQRYYVPEMLGGLMRLLDKGGWGEAFRDGGMR
jgi:hypothetical protein